MEPQLFVLWTKWIYVFSLAMILIRKMLIYI